MPRVQMSHLFCFCCGVMCSDESGLCDAMCSGESGFVMSCVQMSHVVFVL